jgi:hypothetical protein
MTALLIGCGDGRIAPQLAELQAELGIDEAFRLLVPGGPLVLTRPGTEQRVALECVRTYLDVQRVHTCVLVSHQDCRAYGKALGGLGFDQRELLVRDLHRVASLLENEFAYLDVHSYLIPWHENGGGAGFGPAERVG